MTQLALVLVAVVACLHGYRLFVLTQRVKSLELSRERYVWQLEAVERALWRISTGRCCTRICLDTDRITDTPCDHQWGPTDTTCCDVGTRRLERCDCGAQRWVGSDVKQS